VLNHAYGLASRGNTAGALAHVRDYLQTTETDAEAAIWFFHRIADWESPNTALELGDELIVELEKLGRDADARKLALRCGLMREKPT
jgi:hypothetical protein